MEVISITLSRGLTEEDWCVEINGNRYKHLSTNTLDALVEQTLFVAQRSLLENEVADGNEMNSDNSPNPN